MSPPILTPTLAPTLAQTLAMGDGLDMRDRRLLLAHACNVSADRLILLAPADLTPDVIARYQALLTRRSAGEPVAKIIGKRAFWRHDFIVTPDVLDPRPDTETLVQAALDVPFSRVLDLGTGSGCILLSLLADRPTATGQGVDISPTALAVAQQNAVALGLTDRTTLTQSDWFGAIADRFDLIVSNPPYIAASEMADLAADVRNFDPEIALTPGGDGLQPYRVITAQAPAFLAPGGWLMVEIGWQQGADVTRLFTAAGLASIEIRRDLEGRDRVVIGQNTA